MGLLRRLSISIGVAVSLIATLAIASVGAGPGFGQGGGKFTFTDTAAFANFFDPTNGGSVSLSVDSSTFMFRTRAGGPVQTQHMTVLSVNHFVPDPANPFGPPLLVEGICLVIPDSAFVVSGDVQTATLNAVDQSTLCPFFLVPVTGAVPDAAAAGSEGATGLTTPLTVTASWTGTGLTGTSENQGSFRCGNFIATTHDRNQSAFSSFVTASISGLGTFSGGFPDVFGNVSVNTSTQNVAGSGILPPACGGKGG